MGRRTTTDEEFGRLWAALDDVPEGYIGEIVGGEIVTMPRPNAPHGRASPGSECSWAYRTT